MAKIKLNKTKNYTIINNTCLRDERLSLKAKGLFALMFSLPENWDYSVEGLVSICKEEESAVKSTLKELKQCGYLVVYKKMPNETKTGRIEYEYIIYEQPQEKQAIEKQGVENQPLEFQGVENRPQLNKDILNKEEQSKEYKSSPLKAPPMGSNEETFDFLPEDRKISYGLQNFLEDNPQIMVDSMNGFVGDMNYLELNRCIKESHYLQDITYFSFFCTHYMQIVAGKYKDRQRRDSYQNEESKQEEPQKPKWNYKCTRL